MSDFRLSICIATLNRRDYLRETLAALIEQQPNDVEVVIVDGASSDGTDALVVEMFRGRENCRYVRLAQKGGVDQDYARAVDEARGEFCWLMTDDDLPTADAIATILRQLDDGLDLLIVNAEVNTADFGHVLKPKKCEIDRDVDFAPGDCDALMSAAGDLLSFIGAVVIRRSVWTARERQPYFGTEFVHVGVIFQQPLERKARLLAEPLIRIRYGNAQWSRRAFEIWMFKWPGLIWSFPGISDAARAAVTPREPWRSVVFLAMMKVRGCYTSTTYRDMLAGRPLTPLQRLAAWGLAIFPEKPFNAIMSLTVAPLVRRNECLVFELRHSPYAYRPARR